MTLSFVDLETARAAPGLRLVLLRGVPSPWSQAAKALVEIEGVDALGVWMAANDQTVPAWTGMPNAPVAMFEDEPPRSNWADILALVERLAPQPRLVPRDMQQRMRLFGLCHEVMGEGGLLWNVRIATVAASFDSDGERGYPLPVAKYMGRRYGYVPGCGAAAVAAALERLRLLAAQLEESRARGPYYFGDWLSALDVYSAAVVDAVDLLPEEQCAMHPMIRKSLAAQREALGVELPERLLEHRDMMHARHMPLPVQL